MPTTKQTDLTSEEFREVEQRGYGEQGAHEALRDRSNPPEGVAEIDIATGETIREEHVKEPAEGDEAL